MVLVGAQSEFCLRMSKHGALEQDFNVIWVEDAHTTEDADDEGGKFSGESIVAWENRMAHSTAYQRAQCRCLLSKDLWST